MAEKNIYISDTENKIMQQVLSSISGILFEEEKYKDIFLKRYQEMKEQCNWEYPDGPTDNGCAVKYIQAPKEYQDYNILGFDIPTLITLSKEKPISNIIMVVSQDPRRTERYKGMLSISSPFGFHDKSYRGSSRKGFMTPLFEKALAESLNTALYFTDSNKLFTTDKRGVSKASASKYQEILKKEIELMKPSCIIAHGRAAANTLKAIDCKYQYVPYIGNSRMKRVDREQAKINFIDAITNKNK